MSEYKELIPLVELVIGACIISEKQLKVPSHLSSKNACDKLLDQVSACVERNADLEQKLDREWISVDIPPDKEARLFYWVVPKLPHESPYDSSGNPIVTKGAKPRRHEGKWGTWSGLEKPTYYMHPPPKPRGRVSAKLISILRELDREGIKPCGDAVELIEKFEAENKLSCLALDRATKAVDEYKSRIAELESDIAYKSSEEKR